jgi:hypothetical protein
MCMLPPGRSTRNASEIAATFTSGSRWCSIIDDSTLSKAPSA